MALVFLIKSEAMGLHLVGYFLPVLMAASALPMVLRKVPPNLIYGFRTPKTLSSPDIWYAANRIAGWFMLAGAVLALCHNFALWSMHADWPWDRLVVYMAVADLIAVMLASAASSLYLRKL
jgi:uncharacterized membrane protein